MKWKFKGNKIRTGGKTYYAGEVFSKKPPESMMDLFEPVEEEKKKSKSSGGKSGESKSSSSSSTSNTGKDKTGGNDEGTGNE